jgi:hypothetical protein
MGGGRDISVGSSPSILLGAFDLRDTVFAAWALSDDTSYFSTSRSPGFLGMIERILD